MSLFGHDGVKSWILLRGAGKGFDVIKQEDATVDQLRSQAEHLRMIAEGGYIAGDHEEDDMRRIRKQADSLSALAEQRSQESSK